MSEEHTRRPGHRPHKISKKMKDRFPDIPDEVFEQGGMIGAAIMTYRKKQKEKAPK